MAIAYEVAQFDDQGKLGKLLMEMLGAAWQDEYERGLAAGLHVAPAEDELMAADDWYFASADLMNCCFFARDGEETVGAAVGNPYTAELQFVVVRPAYRRQGIGRELVGAVREEFRRRGLTHLKIDLPVHPSLAGAEAFFAALGFGEIRRTVRFGEKI